MNGSNPQPLGESQRFQTGLESSQFSMSFDWGLPKVMISGQTRPLEVIVVGGNVSIGGNTTPPPKKEAGKFESVFDRMPARLESLFGTGSAYGRRAEMGMVNRGTSGSMASFTGLGVGALVGALDKVRQTFIEPFISAAQGGFQSGLNRGMGLETVFKVFETVGITVGIAFLPHIIKTSAAVMEFGIALRRNKDILDGFADGVVDTLDTAFNPLAGIKNQESIKEALGLGGIPLSGLDYLGDIADGLGFGKERQSVGSSLGVGKKTPEQTKSQSRMMELLLARMEKINGGQPYMTNIANVRDQAQMAALQQDPLEAQMKKELLEAIREIKASTKQTADSVSKP